MKINAILDRCGRNQHKCEESGKMETIGDRITLLMRERGRQERGEPYTQSDLVAMLNGKIKAPDGEYYHAKAHRSVISRVLSDQQRPRDEVLFAIADMFGTDTEWLLRGKSREENHDQFFSPEADAAARLIDAMPPDLRTRALGIAQLINSVVLDASIINEICNVLGVSPFATAESGEVARLVDGMDSDLRKAVLTLAQQVAPVNQERKDLQTEVATLLIGERSRFSTSAAPIVSSILGKIDRQRLAGD